jgi:hypothetical protein
LEEKDLAICTVGIRPHEATLSFFFIKKKKIYIYIYIYIWGFGVEAFLTYPRLYEPHN